MGHKLEASMDRNCTTLLTVKQAANLLALKPATIRRRILERRIDYIKLGRAVRIPLTAVEHLIQAGYREALKSEEAHG
jgi:excisionase family DNA binding protein